MHTHRFILLLCCVWCMVRKQINTEGLHISTGETEDLQRTIEQTECLYKYVKETVVYKIAIIAVWKGRKKLQATVLIMI